MMSREADYYERWHSAEHDLAWAKELQFTTSWERMVLLAIYAGPTDSWPERFDDAYMAMIRAQQLTE
jgi:hypothetical protein